MMNSASRVLEVVKSLRGTKSYNHTILSLFKIDNDYEKLMLFRYFSNDIQNIKKIWLQKGSSESFINKKLTPILNFISPNFKDFHIPIYQNIEDDLEMIDGFLDDEKLYLSDIEKIRIALKGVEKTDTFLDGIVDDIDFMVTYYGYFGSNVVEDRAESILSTVFIYQERLKPFIDKYSTIFAMILRVFKIYKELKGIKDDVVPLMEFVQKQIGEKYE